MKKFNGLDKFNSLYNKIILEQSGEQSGEEDEETFGLGVDFIFEKGKTYSIIADDMDVYSLNELAEDAGLPFYESSDEDEEGFDDENNEELFKCALNYLQDEIKNLKFISVASSGKFDSTQGGQQNSTIFTYTINGNGQTIQSIRDMVSDESQFAFILDGLISGDTQCEIECDGEIISY